MSSNLPSALPPPIPLTPITIDNIDDQIGLVQQFFRDKLATNNNKPLIEDDDLPQKQRFPKPRLPPTGKISSPRKRPIREPGPGKGHPRKKMKLNNGDATATATATAIAPATATENNNVNKSPTGKLKLEPPNHTPATTTTNMNGDDVAGVDAVGKENAPKLPSKEKGKVKDKEKEKEKEKEKDMVNGGMISPESLEAT